MKKPEYFKKLESLIARKNDDEAAEAIRKVIRTFIKFELCTQDEFLCLIDLDYKKYWNFIAEQIGHGAELEIRNGNLHPNDLKPWLNCRNYKDKFRDLSSVNQEWRQLHGAINTIIGRINARFNY